MNADKFTIQDVADWERYEEIRQSGKWNMLSCNARYASGLSKERYEFCLLNRYMEGK